MTLWYLLSFICTKHVLILFYFLSIRRRSNYRKISSRLVRLKKILVNALDCLWHVFLFMYTENSAHVHRVHTNNVVSVFCMNMGHRVSVLRKHTSKSTSVICVLTTKNASLHYMNSSNITPSGKRGLKLCLVSSIRVPGLTEFMNSTSKLRLYFNTRQALRSVSRII